MKQINKPKIINVIPVILCGGTGTRLWPLSRASFPKQYLNLIGESNQSLLQQTQLRLKGLKNLSKPILVCSENHRFLVAEQMRQIDIEPKSIILEPVEKNTAPAIAISALEALKVQTDPILLILAADHAIKNIKNFHKTIEAAIPIAESERLVTFGIVPTSAETGFGYIKASKKLDFEKQSGETIEEFIEKPDIISAKEFINDNRFTWNSGMFLFKATTILKEIEKLEPKIIACCKDAISNGKNDLDFFRLDKESFSKCPKLAVDTAVMEKTKLGTVLPLKAGWSDVGSWKSLWEINQKDKNGNFLQGNIFIDDTKNCYLRSENRLTVGLGIKDLVVIETDDAVLISHISKTQEVKKIVNILDKKNIYEGKNHRKVYRPWGNYTSIEAGENWQVKKIVVNPGGSLSLQKHNHRSEHWIVVKGKALIQKDGLKEYLDVNESTYIPQGCIHRLSNPFKNKVELIEVQTGEYLGEDDIIRYEDIYGRIEIK